MAKKKKKTTEIKNLRDSSKPVTVKSTPHVPQKQSDQIKENPVMTLLFGHSSLDKKDIIELGVLLVLVAFLAVMQLKLNNVI